MSDEKIEIPDDLYENHRAYNRSFASDRGASRLTDSLRVRSSPTRSDYNYFRNRKEKTRRNILRSCQEAYDNVPIIKHVIDLMSDFGSKGISIQHTNEKTNKILKVWFDKVKGVERSERFFSSILRLGSVALYSKLGRIQSNNVQSKYIPVEYVMLNPASLEVVGEDTGFIPDKFEYILKPFSTNDSSARINRNIEKKGNVPEFIQKYSNKKLDSSRLSVYNYKKDDWQFWGYSIIYGLLSDLEVLEKLRLADIAALDGAISTVRLWTVGQITGDKSTTIIPNKEKLRQIANIIENGVAGGSMDLVMGPEVKLTETNTTIHQFLGEAKYKPTIDAIYDGLGVPSPLRSSNKDNNGSNFISLKTLIERLNYVRNLLTDFWKKQAKLVMEAIGIDDEDPIIIFDYTVLTDEAAEKKLLLDMVDRDIIDIETVHNRFNIVSELSKNKLKKEVKQRGKELPVKAGPFHNANVQDDMKKIMLQNGSVYPAEAGLELGVTDEEIQKRVKTKEKADRAAKKASSLGNKQFSDVPGRPKNITETKKRKPKTGSAKAVDLAVWATKAQNKISDIYTPIVLEMLNKKNLRSLSVQQFNDLEEAKASILFSLEPYQEITLETIYNNLQNIDNSHIKEVKKIYNELESSSGALTVEQKRQINSIYYSDIN